MTTATEWFEKGMAAISLSRHADYGSEFIGDLEDAVGAFGEVLALEPGNLGALRERGLALALLDRHEEALDAFVAATRLAPLDAELRLAVAQSLLRLDHPEAALEALDEVLRLRPDDAEALFSRASVLMVLKRDALPLTAWNTVLGLDDNRTLSHHGRMVRVLTEDFRRLQAQLSRAMALGRLQRPEATTAFREFFDAHPQQLASSFVERVLHEALRTLEVARAAFRDHLAGLGDDSHAWGRAAGVWLAAQLPHEALHAWDRQLAIAPDAQAWFGKAEAFAQAGELDAAIVACERSLELWPGFLGARARLKVMKALQETRLLRTSE